MPIAAIASAAAAKKALENVIDDIYGLGKTQLGKQIERWKTKSKIDALYKKIKNIRKVKTIWQVEKEIDLLKFYYPAKLKIDDQAKTINYLSDLEYTGNILVQGTIGQGKSIFFRYLASQEMFKGAAIPLFIELRRIKKDEALIGHLLEELKTYGLEMNEGTFRVLAENGKIILFLDAFDEVKEIKRTSLITEIEHFAKRYEKLRIIVSSRPNSGIDVSPFFRVFQLCHLQSDEYQQVIFKMADNDEVAAIINKGISKSEMRIAHLLTTPLMVALLMLRYRIDQTIPENAAAFYGDLFNLLLVRHDKTKAGYVRPKKSDASDIDLYEIFNSICFLTRKDDQGVFTHEELHKYAKKAVSMIGKKYAADKIVEDIIGITCLILEEGGEYKFIHKSVQEYHAACFIKNQPEDSGEKFYKAGWSKLHRWQQELSFLSMIDKYRFLKYFAIPDMKRALGVPRDEDVTAFPRTTLANVMRIVENEGLSVGVNKEGRVVFYFNIHEGESWSMKGSAFGLYIRLMAKCDFLPSLEEMKKRQSVIPKKRFSFDEVYEVRLIDVLNLGLMEKDILRVLNAALKDVYKQLSEAQSFTKRIENNKLVLEL